VRVASADLAFWTRDLDGFAKWRFAHVRAPASLLFPRTACRPLPDREGEWAGRHSFADSPGSALLLDGFARMESRADGNPAAYAGMRSVPGRLLVPVPAGGTVRVRAWAPDGGLRLAARLNGRSRQDLDFAGGWSEVVLPTSTRGWRTGWNVLELPGEANGERRLALDWIEVALASAGSVHP
jgi:hypothetical protein